MILFAIDFLFLSYWNFFSLWAFHSQHRPLCSSLPRLKWKDVHLWQDKACSPPPHWTFSFLKRMGWLFMIRLCCKSLIAFVNNKREFGVLVFAVEELVGNCHQFCMVACCFEHIKPTWKTDIFVQWRKIVTLSCKAWGSDKLLVFKMRDFYHEARDFLMILDRKQVPQKNVFPRTDWLCIVSLVKPSVSWTYFPQFALIAFYNWDCTFLKQQHPLIQLFKHS